MNSFRNIEWDAACEAAVLSLAVRDAGVIAAVPQVQGVYHQLLGERHLAGLLHELHRRPAELTRALRVACYASAMAQALSWIGEVQRKRIVKAAILHRIGDILFPETVPEEHPLKGLLVLDGVGDHDESVKQMVYQHRLSHGWVYPPARLLGLAAAFYELSAVMSYQEFIEQHYFLTPAVLPFRKKAPPPVLVVDDNLDLQELTSCMLARHGHQVLKASNGLEALQVWEQAPDALILSDVRMPGMNGLKFLESLRARGGTNLFVFFSGELTREQAILMGQLGVFEFLEKGSSREVLETVRSALAYRERMADLN